MLAPGGWLVFATLGDGTFAEWREAHARAGLGYEGMPLPSRAELETMLGQTSRGARIAFVEEERIVHAYPDARTFLQDVKCIGAAGAPEGSGRDSAGRGRGLMRALEEAGGAGGANKEHGGAGARGGGGAG